MSFVAQLLGNYRTFIKGPETRMAKGGAAANSMGGMEEWFDFDGYLDTLPKKEQEFARKLTNTQMFSVLVQNTVEASADDVRLLFFDEYTDVLMQRRRKLGVAYDSAKPHNAAEAAAKALHLEQLHSLPPILSEFLMDLSQKTTGNNKDAGTKKVTGRKVRPQKIWRAESTICITLGIFVVQVRVRTTFCIFHNVHNTKEHHRVRIVLASRVVSKSDLTNISHPDPPPSSAPKASASRAASALASAAAATQEAARARTDSNASRFSIRSVVLPPPLPPPPRPPLRDNYQVFN